MDKVKSKKIRKKTVKDVSDEIEKKDKKKEEKSIFDEVDKKDEKKKVKDIFEDAENRVKKKEAKEIFENIEKKKTGTSKKVKISLKGRKVRKNNVEKMKYDSVVSSDELELDRVEKEAIQQDDLSVGVICLILFVCIVVGVSVGYLLYRLAINSSAALLVPFL